MHMKKSWNNLHKEYYQDSSLLDSFETLYSSLSDANQRQFLNKWRSSIEQLNSIELEDVFSYAIPITKESLRDLQFLYATKPIAIDDVVASSFSDIEFATQQGEEYCLLIQEQGELSLVSPEYMDQYYAIHAPQESHLHKPLSHKERLLPYLPIWRDHVLRMRKKERWSLLQPEFQEKLLTILSSDAVAAQLASYFPNLLKYSTLEELIQDRLLLESSDLNIGDYVAVRADCENMNQAYHGGDEYDYQQEDKHNYQQEDIDPYVVYEHASLYEVISYTGDGKVFLKDPVSWEDMWLYVVQDLLKFDMRHALSLLQKQLNIS